MCALLGGNKRAYPLGLALEMISGNLVLMVKILVHYLFFFLNYNVLKPRANDQATVLCLFVCLPITGFLRSVQESFLSILLSWWISP